jgi:tetratricopeptide (TPR) repeat protein
LFTPLISRSIRLLFCLLILAVSMHRNLIAQEADTTTASGLIDASYASMVKADLTRDGGDITDALQGYRNALSGFIEASKRYPELDPEVVRFRIVYCDNQIETIVKEMGGSGTAAPDTRKARDSRPPALIQTATAKADAMGMQLRTVRKQISAREHPSARNNLITLLKQSPDDPEIRILMSIVQCMLGRFDDAENMLSALIEEQPDLSRAHAVRSTAQIGLGFRDKAKVSLEKAIALGSTSPEVFYDMTQIILVSKPLDTEAARKNYRHSLKLGGRKDPDLDYLLK